MNKSEFYKAIGESETDENMVGAMEWLMKARFGDEVNYDKLFEKISVGETEEI